MAFFSSFQRFWGKSNWRDLSKICKHSNRTVVRYQIYKCICMYVTRSRGKWLFAQNLRYNQKSFCRRMCFEVVKFSWTYKELYSPQSFIAFFHVECTRHLQVHRFCFLSHSMENFLLTFKKWLILIFQHSR